MPLIATLFWALQSADLSWWNHEHVLRDVERAWKSPQVFASQGGTGLFLRQNGMMPEGIHRVQLTDEQYLRSITAVYTRRLQRIGALALGGMALSSASSEGRFLLRIGLTPNVPGGWTFISSADHRKAFLSLTKERNEELQRARKLIARRCEDGHLEGLSPQDKVTFKVLASPVYLTLRTACKIDGVAQVGRHLAASGVDRFGQRVR